MPNPIEPSVARRLTLVRQFLDNAIQTSMMAGPLSAGIAVSLCQDAVELLLRGVLEHLHATGKDANPPTFDAVVEAVEKIAKEQSLPALSDRAQLVQLNKARVNVKHHGVLPDEHQSRDLVFRCSRISFDIAFHYMAVDLQTFTLAEMIARRRVRNHLVNATNFLKSEKYAETCISAGKAFALIFGDTESNADDLEFTQYWEVGRTRFGFLSEGRSDPVGELRAAAKADIEKLGGYCESLANQVELLRLGIDYPQMVRFGRLVPAMGLSAAGTIAMSINHDIELTTKDEAEFCIAFAANAIIRAQPYKWGVGIKAESTSNTVTTIVDTKLLIWPDTREDGREVLAEVKAGTALFLACGNAADGFLPIAYEGEQCYAAVTAFGD